MESTVSSKDDPIQFSVLAQDGKARRGILEIKHKGKRVETPNCILYSRNGTPPNLTPDILKDFKEATMLQVGFQDLYLDAAAIRDFKQGIHKFLNLNDRILYVSFRDPSEYVEFPLSETTMNVNTKSGKQKVTPKEFMDVQKSFNADFFECLSIDVPYYITSKRVRKSVDISLSWLDQCTKLQEKDTAMFGVIQGGVDIVQRIRSAKETAKRNVAGFVLGGFGLGETNDQRVPLVNAIIKELPETKPRVLPGLGTPEEIFHGIELGADLFNTNYPNIVTEWGCAFTFSYVVDKKSTEFKINLRDKCYQLDKSPLIEGCQCYSCKNHTKAYINHLLNVHELLANVLLTIHNCYHYQEFFKAIRESITKGTFNALKDHVLGQI